MFNPIKFTRDIYEQLKAIRLEIKALRQSIMVLNRMIERTCNLDDSALESALWTIVEGKVPKSKTKGFLSEPEHKSKDDLPAKEGRCRFELYGNRCCRRHGHSGDHNFLCEDPDCPGYQWIATIDDPHPKSSCLPHRDLFPELYGDTTDSSCSTSHSVELENTDRPTEEDQSR